MGATENLATARAVTAAFESGDMAKLDELTADDIVWHEIGRAESRRGKDALRAVSPGTTDYTIEGKTHDILASDDHAIALVEATATRAGRTFTTGRRRSITSATARSPSAGRSPTTLPRSSPSSPDGGRRRKFRPAYRLGRPAASPNLLPGIEVLPGPRTLSRPWAPFLTPRSVRALYWTVLRAS